MVFVAVTSAYCSGVLSADATSKIDHARAGRASYISSENLIGHNDPGAEAVARLFENLAS